MAYLHDQLSEQNVILEQKDSSGASGSNIRVQKIAGGKTVIGTFIIRPNDTFAPGEKHTLVVMKRSKVSQINIVLGYDGRWILTRWAGVDIALEGILVVDR